MPGRLGECGEEAFATLCTKRGRELGRRERRKQYCTTCVKVHRCRSRKSGSNTRRRRRRLKRSVRPCVYEKASYRESRSSPAMGDKAEKIFSADGDGGEARPIAGATTATQREAPSSSSSSADSKGIRNKRFSQPESLRLLGPSSSPEAALRSIGGAGATAGLASATTGNNSSSSTATASPPPALYKGSYVRGSKKLSLPLGLPQFVHRDHQQHFHQRFHRFQQQQQKQQQQQQLDGHPTSLEDEEADEVTRSLERTVRKISRGGSPNPLAVSPVAPPGTGSRSPDPSSAAAAAAAGTPPNGGGGTSAGFLGLSGLARGYEQYRESLTFLHPTTTEYGEASSDDLSSEWETSSASDLENNNSNSKDGGASAAAAPKPLKLPAYSSVLASKRLAAAAVAEATEVARSNAAAAAAAAASASGASSTTDPQPVSQIGQRPPLASPLSQLAPLCAEGESDLRRSVGGGGIGGGDGADAGSKRGESSSSSEEPPLPPAKSQTQLPPPPSSQREGGGGGRVKPRVSL